MRPAGLHGRVTEQQPAGLLARLADRRHHIGANSAGQCTTTSSCWKNTNSAAVPWMTKFRVNRPRSRAT